MNDGSCLVRGEHRTAASLADEIECLQLEAERLRTALFGDNGALTRMDQARRILHKGPNSNWGLLDTSDIRRTLSTKDRGHLENVSCWCRPEKNTDGTLTHFTRDGEPLPENPQ